MKNILDMTGKEERDLFEDIHGDLNTLNGALEKVKELSKEGIVKGVVDLIEPARRCIVHFKLFLENTAELDKTNFSNELDDLEEDVRKLEVDMENCEEDEEMDNLQDLFCDKNSDLAEAVNSYNDICETIEETETMINNLDTFIENFS